MKKSVLFVCSVLVLMIMASSCSYRCATVMPEEIRKGGIALGTVSNLTEESLLRTYLKNAFGLEMAKTPGLGLRTAADAEYCIDLKICSMNTRSVVTAEIREGVDDDNDDTAYQTILHEENLEVGYCLYKRSNPSARLMEGRVRASVVMPSMHDREVMLRSSNQKAAAEAARKIVNALTENW